MTSKSFQPYTSEKIRTIKDLAGTKSCPEIASVIGRTATSVAQFCSTRQISLKVTADSLTDDDKKIIECLEYISFTKSSDCRREAGLKDGPFKTAITKLIRIGRVEYSTIQHKGRVLRVYRLLPESCFGVSAKLSEFDKLLRGANAA